MTILVAVTAALVLAASYPHASAVSDVRIIRSATGSPLPRYVRLRFDAVTYGIAGTEEITIDTATGRYVDRTHAGPLSESDGYDGIRTWSADATGLAENDEHPDDRTAGLEWSYLVARPPATAPRVVRLAADAHETTLRLRYPALSRGFDVAIDRASGLVSRAVLYGGSDAVRVFFGEYRRSGDLIVPATIATRSSVGTTRLRLRSVSVVPDVPRSAFSRPAFPHDASLAGVTTIPMQRRWYGLVIEARVDGGPPLRMLIDTGANFTLTPRAARRCGLHVVGSGHVGGIGPAYIPERYAIAHRLRIGAAELGDQPLEVFAMKGLANDELDGIVGSELFARFAARLDFAGGTLQLARDAALLHPRGTRLPIMLYGGEPQVRGTFDGIRGLITLDTGSTYGLDVLAPTVREHDLMRRYHATEREDSTGIGGGLVAYVARAQTLRLGDTVIRDVPMSLDVASTGGMADPSLAGNLGLAVLERFTLVLDYRGRAAYLEPRT